MRYIPACLFLLISCLPAQSAGSECVILLHGLARVSNSMGELETKLARAGYESVNISYPSTSNDIGSLAREAVSRGLNACAAADTSAVHFVTHSLGGILVRKYLSENNIPDLGRVVMLGPPNQGAELVDHLRNVPGFGFLGPAAKSLGTGEDSIFASLDPVQFDLGVIAGDVNVNPLAAVFLDEANDSVVTVASTRVEGMREHLVLPVMHTLMMRDNDVIDHAIHYLKTGNFIPQ